MEYMNINWSVLSIFGFILMNSIGLIKYMIAKIDRMDRRITREIEKAFATYLRHDSLIELNQIVMNVTDEVKELRTDNIEQNRKLNERLDKMIESHYLHNRKN